MSNAVNLFLPTYNVKRLSRSKLHKYLIRERPEEKVVNEIQNGPACIYQRTKNGHSSLFLALAGNKENVIKMLIETYEKDFKVLIENGYKKDTAVLIAFGAKDIEFVEEKLSKFSSEVNDDDKDKFLILMKEKNDSTSLVKTLMPKTEDEQKLLLEIIERLHVNGTFDIDIPDSNGNTLFAVAASQGLISVLEKLLELGARHDLLNYNKETPFEFACVCNQIETVKWYNKKFKPDLLKFMMEGNALFQITHRGSFEAFDYIMSEIKRHDGDEHIEEIFGRKTEYHGGNILMEAVTRGQQDFAIKCLKFDPDLSIVDISGNNIFHVVLNSWPLHEELLKLLIKREPELLLVEDSNQWTPLHFLATRNLLNEIKDIYEKFPSYKNYFFKHFADSPTVQKTLEQIWCSTPGHFALNNVANAGFFEMADFILENHSEEFHSAVYISSLVIQSLPTGSIEFIEKLQKFKSFDINVPDENNNYPLIVALQSQQFEIYQHLLNSCVIKDINVMIEQHSKYNLLYYAIYKTPEVFRGCCVTGCFPPESDSSDDENEVKQNICSIFPEPQETDEKKKQKYFDIFMDLIKRGVDPKHKSQENETLLHVAVKNDNVEVVKELSKHGLEVCSVDKLGNTPLHYVKSSEVFKILKEDEEITKLINFKNEEGQSPFINIVSHFGNENVPKELVEEFLKLKCDVNAADNDGCRPIHLAGTEEWMKILIENGADISATNNNGENVIHIALKNMKWSLARFLLRNTNIDRFAITNDEISYLGYLTNDVKISEIFDGELKEVYNQLLDKFINGKTLHGVPIITSFIARSDLKKILHPKADLHQVEADGKTCLHNAVIFNSSIELLKVLIDAGLDINAVNENGFTPLMYSTDHNFTDIALFLIEQENINLNLANSYGFTALHYAARNENIKVLSKLLLAGADPKISTNENKIFYDFLTELDKKLFASYALAAH